MDEHDAEREADDGADREAERGLLRGEERLVERMFASAGWFTCAGSANAFAIVQTCGIEMSSTTNGHVQPADVQTSAVELPETDQDGDDGDRRDDAQYGSRGRITGGRTYRCDSSHGDS